MSDISFAGRVAVVTGAGGGLGRTYALELARRGAQVVVNDFGGLPDGTGGERDRADSVVAEIRSAGGDAIADYESVASKDGGRAIVQTALDNYGQLDIVINNAGILRDRSFAKLSFADLDAVLDVHLRGAVFVSQPAFVAMKERGYGRILFTTSAAGLFGNFGQANYSAAKMGLVGLSSTLAIEGAGSGIQSNVIAPLAGTRLTTEILGPQATALFDPGWVTPLACYLVSEQCTQTHEVFSVGAGRYARVFVAVTPGWRPKDVEVPSLEGVARHLDLIRDEKGYVCPLSVSDELELVTAGSGGTRREAR